MNKHNLIQIVLDEIGGSLDKGFKQRGRIFTRRISDVIQFIQVQKSIKSRADSSLVTINIGICSSLIAEREELDVSKMILSHEAHWQQRLGNLMRPIQNDAWWLIKDQKDAKRIGEEISVAIRKYAMPLLDEFSSTEKLIKTWSQGIAPGLTDFQRKKYLQYLNL